MPIINKQKTNSRYKYKKHGKQAEIQKLYNSSNWVNLRNAYLMKHPLCEICEAKGLTIPAQEIHHIKPISTGEDILEMMDIAFNPNNLQALCVKCHHEIHKRMKK